MRSASPSPVSAFIARVLSLVTLLTACACGPEPARNPASLWLSFAEREVDLVLIDHEPPIF